MFCCNKYTKIGCFTDCDCVYTDLIAVHNGEHEIQYRYNYLDTVFIQKIEDLNAGDNIYFPMRVRENSTVFFRIINPDSSVFSQDGSECFCVKVSPSHIVGSAMTTDGCNLIAHTPLYQGDPNLIINQPNPLERLFIVSFVVPPTEVVDGYIINVSDQLIKVDSSGMFTADIGPGSVTLTVTPTGRSVGFLPININISVP